MSSSSQDLAQIESEEDARSQGRTDVDLWLSKLKEALKEEEDWRKEAAVAVKVYEAAKNKDSTVGYNGKPIFNIFYSNCRTLEPAVYNSTPVPDVRRTFSDKDDVAQFSAVICERALSANLGGFDFDSRMKYDVKGAIVAGRGISRVRYKPFFAKAIAPNADLDAAAKKGNVDGEEYDKLVHEEALIENVRWDDYCQGPASDWEQVPFVAFRHNLSKAECKRLIRSSKQTLSDEEVEKRLGQLSFTQQSTVEDSNDEKDKPKKGILKTIVAWEIWDKISETVIYVAECCKDFPLAIIDDPLKLSGFFPNPNPLQSGRRVSSQVPLCMHTIYADLTDEIDETTVKIRETMDRMRVRALADPKLKDDIEALAKADGGDTVYSQNVEQFLKNGPAKIEDFVMWWPIEQEVALLKQLQEHREQLKALIYEVTGLSDVIRGESNRSQTATEINTKASWGSQRIQDLQQEIDRYARDLMKMMAEAIFNNFQEKTIRNMTLLPEPLDEDEIREEVAAQLGVPANDNGANGQQAQQPDPQQAQMAINAAIQKAQQDAEAKFKKSYDLLKSQLRFFRIDIETDSTRKATILADQTQVTNFVGMTSQYFQAAAPIAQLAPDLFPSMVELWTKIAQRSVKLGKGGDDVLSKIVEMAEKAVKGGLNVQNSAQAQQEQAAQAQAQQQAQEAQNAHDKQMQDDKHAHEKAMADGQRQTQSDKIAHDRFMADAQQQKQVADQQHDATLSAISQSQEIANANHDAAVTTQGQAHEAAMLDAQHSHDALMAHHDQVMAFLDAHQSALDHGRKVELEALKAKSAEMKAKATAKKGKEAA